MKKTHHLGVLFVHGIGEQPKGDTLLRFGDPCIAWLERWLEKHKKSLRVERVDVTDHVPVAVSIECESEPERILFKESWWASRFAPPEISELSWWMLLVGTWATLSHSIKPLKLRVDQGRSTVLPLLRSVFFYVPIAFSFQIVILLVSVLGAVPFTPWRGYLANLLLKMSRTLGDSYVLLHSPTQEQMAIQTVAADIEAITAASRRSMIVAHSQGAAIAYHALKRALPAASDVVFISVGSGLEKLEELRALNDALEYRGEPDSIYFRHLLYLVPALFLGFWGVIVTSLALGWPGWSLVAVFAFALFSALLAVLYRIKLPDLKTHGCDWHDLFARLDPVSNGPVNAELTSGTAIVNEQSLLRDHTSYFRNKIDFLPRLVSHMREFGGVGWIDDVQLDKLETAARRWRKTVVQFSKWVNFAGLLYYAAAANSGFDGLLTSLGKVVAWVASSTLGIGEKPQDLELLPWVFGLGVFVVADVIIRWADRTAERTYTNLLFKEQRMLRRLGHLLTWLPLAAATGFWLFAILSV